MDERIRMASKLAKHPVQNDIRHDTILSRS